MPRQFVKHILFGFTIILAITDSPVSGIDLKVVLEQPLLSPSPNVVATSLILNFPPGDEGSPPHYHSGPVVGYVLEGSFLFQVYKNIL